MDPWNLSRDAKVYPINHDFMRFRKPITRAAKYGNGNCSHTPSDIMNFGSVNDTLGSSRSLAPFMRRPDLSIRAANEKLGGVCPPISNADFWTWVVHAGGGPNDHAPQRWKPWERPRKVCTWLTTTSDWPKGGLFLLFEAGWIREPSYIPSYK